MAALGLMITHEDFMIECSGSVGEDVYLEMMDGLQWIWELSGIIFKIGYVYFFTEGRDHAFYHFS